MFISESLEFSRYKELVSNTFSTVFGKEKLNNLKPVENIKNIEQKQGYLREAVLVSSIIPVQLPYDEKYYELYKKLKDPYASFTENDIGVFRDFHSEVAELKKKLSDCESFQALRHFTKDIYLLSDLLKSIFEKLTPDCKVKDSASSELRHLRFSLKSTRKKLIDHLNKLLFSGNSEKFIQDQVIKEVKGRYVIPVKSNFRQYFSGVVYSSSNTGQTLYVEPASAIDMNNEYEDLKAREKEEVLRILQTLLREIKSYTFEITSSVSAYTELVFYFETAFFLQNKKYTFPEVGDELLFEKVHHPLIYLLKGGESVPLDFKMEEGVNLSVITGPNTGGKTAALKSAGLNCIVARCGLPVFGDKAKIVNFRSVYADIGDHQSLVLDLSTFSSHIINIRDIISGVCENSLILLDELGTGTEPKEGAALAVSIIDHLLGKGSKVIVTTHFSEVKNYALRSEKAIIYSVDFDYDNFTPRYRLLSGVVGKSSPIVVARKLNFDEKILKAAEDIISENSNQAEVKLEDVNTLKAEVERKANELNIKEQELERKLSETSKKDAELSKKLHTKETELLEESYALLNKLRRMSKKKQPVHSEKQVRQLEEDFEETEKKLQNLQKKQKPVEDISPGDKVFLEKYSREAEVLSIQEDKVYVDISGIKVHMDKKDLIGRKIDKQTDNVSQKAGVTKPASGSVNPELVIVGKTVDKGWEILDQYIDKALMAGLSMIYVIHGRGSGQLKKGVREHLKNDPRVVSLRDATNEEGGQAVTIVNL